MTVIEIKAESDIVEARTAARVKAGEMGFGLVDQTRISTAVSELARNMFTYAGGGEVRITSDCSPHHGLKISFVDPGPGIDDVDLALTDGYSTGDSMGKGLPGAKRLSDSLQIISAPGKGTTVIIEKWLRDWQ